MTCILYLENWRDGEQAVSFVWLRGERHRYSFPFLLWTKDFMSVFRLHVLFLSFVSRVRALRVDSRCVLLTKKKLTFQHGERVHQSFQNLDQLITKASRISFEITQRIQTNKGRLTIFVCLLWMTQIERRISHKIWTGVRCLFESRKLCMPRKLGGVFSD